MIFVSILKVVAKRSGWLAVGFFCASQLFACAMTRKPQRDSVWQTARPTKWHQGVSTHVVRPGDTLYSLSRRYHVGVEQLQRLNGLASPQALQVGTILLLRPPRAQAAPPASRLPWSKLPAKPAAKQTPRQTGSIHLAWPVKGVLTSAFGLRRGARHDGIDIGVPKGTPVLAAAAGEVVFADEYHGYGNMVIVKHPHDFMTVYAHHATNQVHKGQRVQQGQILGLAGETGRSTGPHVHFEVRHGAIPQDPLRYLQSVP